MKVYLCGPIMNCNDSECKDWREYVKSNYNGECLDPMLRDYRGKEGDFSIEIVEQDKKDIDECDIVLVNYVKPSIGTSMEMLYAWERDKEIYVVTVEDKEKLSPWLLYHCHVIFKDFDHVIRMLNNKIKENKKTELLIWQERNSREMNTFITDNSFCRGCGESGKAIIELTGASIISSNGYRHQYKCLHCTHRGYLGRSRETKEFGIWT